MKSHAIPNRFDELRHFIAFFIRIPSFCLAVWLIRNGVGDKYDIKWVEVDYYKAFVVWSALTLIPFWMVHRFRLRRWFLGAFVLTLGIYYVRGFFVNGAPFFTRDNFIFQLIVLAPLIAFAIAPRPVRQQAPAAK